MSLFIPPGQINVGAELIGLYINLVLYGVEIMLATVYLVDPRAKRDSKIILLAVATNLILDTVISFVQCAAMFSLLIIYWGVNIDHIPMYWSIPLRIFTTGIGGFVVQLFLTQRYYRLSANRVVSAFVFLLIMLSICASFYLGVVVSLASTRIKEEQLHDLKSMIINLAATVATDICITCALLWTLLIQEQTFSLHTKHIVRRVSAFAVVTGTVTSAVALATLISYLVDRQGGISPCFAFFLGRVYTLTMLLALIFRSKLAGKAFMNVDFIDDGAELSSIPSQQTPISDISISPMSVNTDLVFATPPSGSRSSQSSIRTEFKKHMLEQTQTTTESSLSPDSVDVASPDMSGMEEGNSLTTTTEQ